MRTLKRLWTFAIAFICLPTLNAYAQYTVNDFTVNTIGLSQEYASHFKTTANLEVLAGMFNRLDVTHSIAPIKVTVLFKNNVGFIVAEVRFGNGEYRLESDYRLHEQSSKIYGSGVSILLQTQIFTALSEYKKSVARDNYSVANDVLKFGSTVTLIKQNGDFMMLNAYNEFNSSGFYPYRIFSSARLGIGGKKYNIVAQDSKILNDMNYFLFGNLIGLDGKKTTAFYLQEFFQTSINAKNDSVGRKVERVGVDLRTPTRVIRKNSIIKH